MQYNFNVSFIDNLVNLLKENQPDINLPTDTPTISNYFIDPNFVDNNNNYYRDYVDDYGYVKNEIDKNTYFSIGNLNNKYNNTTDRLLQLDLNYENGSVYTVKFDPIFMENMMYQCFGEPDLSDLYRFDTLKNFQNNYTSFTSDEKNDGWLVGIYEPDINTYPNLASFYSSTLVHLLGKDGGLANLLSAKIPSVPWNEFFKFYVSGNYYTNDFIKYHDIQTETSLPVLGINHVQGQDGKPTTDSSYENPTWLHYDNTFWNYMSLTVQFTQIVFTTSYKNSQYIFDKTKKHGVFGKVKFYVLIKYSGPAGNETGFVEYTGQ